MSSDDVNWFEMNLQLIPFQEDIKSLITHIVENHYRHFENVDYVQTFKNLQQRYEQLQDRLRDRASIDRLVPTLLQQDLLITFLQRLKKFEFLPFVKIFSFGKSGKFLFHHQGIYDLSLFIPLTLY